MRAGVWSPTRWFLLLVLLVVMAGFVLLGRVMTVRAERPVLQGAEELMVDQLWLLRAEVEGLMERGVDPVPVLERRWERAWEGGEDVATLRGAGGAGEDVLDWSQARMKDAEGAGVEGRLGVAMGEEARIFGKSKRGLSLYGGLYDADGVLLWSSYGRMAEQVGTDFSRANDVGRALRGEYGARSSRLVEDRADSSVLFVSLPVRLDGQVVGVVSVMKEQAELNPFVHAYWGRTMLAVGLIGGGITLFVLGVSIWLIRPMNRLRSWALAVGEGERRPLPRLGYGRRARGLGMALERMRDALDGRRELAAYARHVSHELKSPLTGIRAAAELLALPELPMERRERLTRALEHEVERSERVLSLWHGLARLEEMPSLEANEWVDLVSLGREAVRRRRQRGLLSGVELVWVGELGLEVARVCGQLVLLEAAVDNLVENALDFSPQDGVVEMDCVAGDGGGWCLRVMDRGAGVPEFARERVFERFFSLRSAEMGGKSSGLGLNLVWETMQLHGGEVELLEREGGGTVAVLVFADRE